MSNSGKFRRWSAYLNPSPKEETNYAQKNLRLFDVACHACCGVSDHPSNTHRYANLCRYANRSSKHDPTSQPNPNPHADSIPHCQRHTGKLGCVYCKQPVMVGKCRRQWRKKTGRHQDKRGTTWHLKLRMVSKRRMD